jgi:hypothetical protein
MRLHAFSSLLLPLLLTACGTGSSGPLGADTGNTVDGQDGGGQEEQEEGEPEEEEEKEEPKPSKEDWEGDWVGHLRIDPLGEDYWDGCDGELALDLDADGEADGDGWCESSSGTLDVEFVGQFDELGQVEGTLTIGFTYAGDTDVELWAAPNGDDELVGAFEGLYLYESWGSEYKYDLTGSFELLRD